MRFGFAIFRFDGNFCVSWGLNRDNHQPNIMKTMKSKLRSLALGFAVLLTAASPLTSMSAPANTGIRGRTHIFTGPFFPGPVAPTVVTSFPVATSFTVMAAGSGRIVAQVTSDDNGDFSLSLNPGLYIIVPADLPDTLFCSYETPEPFEVTVRPRQVSGAGFTYVADCPPIIATPAP